MDRQQKPPARSRRGFLAVAATALAVAVALPVSGSFAGGDGGGSGERSASEALSGSTGSVQTQEQRPDDRQGPGRDRDCPEKDRGSQSQGGEQTTPEGGLQEL
jgi:hypothetical protein